MALSTGCANKNNLPKKNVVSLELYQFFSLQICCLQRRIQSHISSEFYYNILSDSKIINA